MSDKLRSSLKLTNYRSRFRHTLLYLNIPEHFDCSTRGMVTVFFIDWLLLKIAVLNKMKALHLLLCPKTRNKVNVLKRHLSVLLDLTSHFTTWLSNLKRNNGLRLCFKPELNCLDSLPFCCASIYGLLNFVSFVWYDRLDGVFIDRVQWYSWSSGLRVYLWTGSTPRYQTGNRLNSVFSGLLEKPQYVPYFALLLRCHC